MNIFAAEKAEKWLLKNATFPYSIDCNGHSFEVTTENKGLAVRLCDYLRDNGHVIEIFGGLYWRVF